MEKTLVTESGVPSAAATTHARIYINQSQSHGTGLAIANPTTSKASITFKAYEKDGITPTGAVGPPLILETNEHRAKFVSELILGLPTDFSGVLDISASSPFVALTLQSRINSRGDFLLTTFPIADATQSAPSPLVFPQIADGGGYLTSFVFLGTEAPCSLDLSFYDDDGTLLNIGSSNGVVEF
jgi:hypothetical protein